jgi:hypothetical protein
MNLSPRRYYLLKWRGLEELDERELSLIFKAKQTEIAGTALPTDFPGRAALIAAGYTAIEDVTGADEEELMSLGLDEQTAAQAVEAVSE